MKGEHVNEIAYAPILIVVSYSHAVRTCADQVESSTARFSRKSSGVYLTFMSDALLWRQEAFDNASGVD